MFELRQRKASEMGVPSERKLDNKLRTVEDAVGFGEIVWKSPTVEVNSMASDTYFDVWFF